MQIVIFDTDTKQRKILESLDYQCLVELYKLRSKVQFFCGCNMKTNMIINKRVVRKDSKPIERYYFSTKQGEKESHKRYCQFFGSLSESLRGYSINPEDDTIEFLVSTKKDSKALTLDDMDEVVDILHSNDAEVIKNHLSSNGIRRNRLTFNAFVFKMLVDTWNQHYRAKYSEGISDNTVDYLRVVFGKSKRYSYNQVSVQKLLKANDEKFDFRYGILKMDGERISTELIGSIVRFTVQDTFGEKTYTVKKGLWDDAIASFSAKSDGYIVFIKRDADRYKSIKEIAIIPINKYGLPVESSYENLFYNRLVEREIFFEKPFEEIGEEYPYVPDALIKYSAKNKCWNACFEKSKGDLPIIFELFGVQGNEKYEQLKVAKELQGDLINSSSDGFYAYSSVEIDTPRDLDLFINKIGYSDSSIERN